jgi:magnesium transporter
VYTALYRPPSHEVCRLTGDDEITAALREPDGLLWLDLLVTDQEADARLLREVFHFHPLTIEDAITDREDPAKIDDHEDYLFIVVQSLREYVSNQELQSDEVDFYLGPNYVVSCHRDPVPSIEAFRFRCEQDPLLLHRGADWLLHGLLDLLVDDYLPIVDALDEEIDRLEDEALHTPDSSVMQRVMMAKRNTLRLRRAATPQRDIMNRLSREEFTTLVRPESRIYFRDIFDHLVRVEYLIEALRDLADNALSTYLSAVSNRLNEVMKVLTAAATIFLPLTLISGVYGMNFEKNQWPAFDAPWGFPAVVGSMLLIGVVSLLYFRLRRWL